MHVCSVNAFRPYLIDSSVYAPADHKFPKFEKKKIFNDIDFIYFVPADNACHSVNDEAFH